MTAIWRRFDELADLAGNGKNSSMTNYYVVALGIRHDGAKVFSTNGHVKIPACERIMIRVAHAEQRLLRKLDKGSEVYVARLRSDGSFGNAKPCKTCQRKLRIKGVSRVFYTISEHEYGCIDVG